MLSKIRKPFAYTFKNVTLFIILINVAVFLLEGIYPPLKYYFSLNIINCLGRRMFWQPFTYMFIHGNFQHLLFNMLGLFFFGTSVEKAIGSKEYLLMYLVTGTLCGCFSLITYYFTGSYMVFLMGASGAVYGMLLAYAVIFPRSKIWIWGLIPVSSPILVIAYAVIEFASQIFNSKDGVAHSVHLAGFFFSWLYFLIRMGINPIKVWKNYR